jgi:hypothetical protein
MKNISELLKNYSSQEIDFFISDYPRFFDKLKSFCVKNNISIMEIGKGNYNTKINLLNEVSFFLIISSPEIWLKDVNNPFEWRMGQVPYSISIPYRVLFKVKSFFSTKIILDSEIKEFRYYPLKELHKPIPNTRWTYDSMYNDFSTFEIFLNSNKLKKHNYAEIDVQTLFSSEDINSLKDLNDFIYDYFSLLIKEKNIKREIIESEFMKMKIKYSTLFNEDNSFLRLLIENQKEMNGSHIHNFIKLAEYINIKKRNLENIILSVRDLYNDIHLNDVKNVLDQEFYLYNLILVNALAMLNSALEGDLVNYFLLYEKFDKSNIFNSNLELEFSSKLTDIKSNLIDVINELKFSTDNIVSSINDLSHITQNSSLQITSKLNEVNSSLEFSNLISIIQTYQMFKIKNNI